MANTIPRETILQQFKKKKACKKPLIGYGAGSGLSAKTAESCGVDYISIYTTAKYRMEGLPTILAWMPYGDVNQEMLSLSQQILPLIDSTPCFAGLGPHDPRVELPRLVDSFADLGYSGINNEPFSSMYGSTFTELLNRVGLGLDREAALIEVARQRDLFTTAWASSEQEATIFAQAGADLIGALLPIALPGEHPDEYFYRCMEAASDTVRAARAVRPDILTVIHGGSLKTPMQIQEGLLRTGADGYASGSNIERIPSELGIQTALKDLDGLYL